MKDKKKKFEPVTVTYATSEEIEVVRKEVLSAIKDQLDYLKDK